MIANKESFQKIEHNSFLEKEIKEKLNDFIEESKKILQDTKEKNISNLNKEEIKDDLNILELQTKKKKLNLKNILGTLTSLSQGTNEIKVLYETIKPLIEMLKKLLHHN